MKFFKTILLALVITTASSFTASVAEITIKTTIYCSHFDKCETGKSKLEKELMLTSGIKEVNIDRELMTINVKYNPKRISPEKIKEVISKAGYDADDVKADPNGYEKLDDCCKKPE